MECVASNNEVREKISRTVATVNDLSYQERKDGLTQAEIDHFLDKILEIKESIVSKTESLNKLNDILDKLCQVNGMDEECLKLLNLLIGIGKQYYFTLHTYEDKLSVFSSTNTFIQEINDFKDSIDIFKENLDDLESIFFTLPSMPDFVEVTQKLSSL